MELYVEQPQYFGNYLYEHHSRRNYSRGCFSRLTGFDPPLRLKRESPNASNNRLAKGQNTLRRVLTECILIYAGERLPFSWSR